MTRSYEQDPDLYEDDARPLRDETSIEYTPPPWLKSDPEPDARDE